MLVFESLRTVSSLIQSKKVSSVELVETLLARVEATHDRLNAFVTVCGEQALAQAKIADRMIADGCPQGPLTGIPVAIKDMIQTKNIRTGCGSLVLGAWVPDADAAVVERLGTAGTIMLGKVATMECASFQHPDIDPPRNPWNAKYYTSGSSHGSAVAVAAGLVYGSIGTDTGGSIRGPSAANGVVGLKPTYGRVSRYGVFPLAESLDCVGPIARNVADVALLFAAIAGADSRDPTSFDAPVPTLATLDATKPRELRLGFDRNWAFSGCDSDLVSAIDTAVEVFRDAGVTIVDIEMPSFQALRDHWFALLSAEAAHAHAHLFEDHGERYNPVLREMVKSGRAVPGVQYFDIELKRRAYRASLSALVGKLDGIISPVFPFATASLEEQQMLHSTPEGLSRLTRFTAPFSQSGHPTLTLPCGFTENGLPIGMQLVGAIAREDRILAAGQIYETETTWHNQHPVLDLSE